MPRAVAGSVRGRACAASLLLACITVLLGAAPSAGQEYPTLDRPTAGVFLDVEAEHERMLESNITPAPPRRALGQAGVDLLKLNEGELLCPGGGERRHCPYNDSSGYCTIGHGHLIARQRCQEIEPLLRQLEFYGGISDERAEEILVQDLSAAQRSIERHMDEGAQRLGVTELTPSQYEALVSFVFNIGGGNFASSTLLKSLQKRSWVGADWDVAYQFSRWRMSAGQIVPGLVNRRRREIDHFFTGFQRPDLGEERRYVREGAVFDGIDVSLGESAADD